MAAVKPKHVYFPDRAALRAWLMEHHASHASIWLVYDKALPGKPRALTYDAIVEEALCFGWIDSLSGSVDERRAKLYFSPRKSRSGWSALNKQRIEKLEAARLMHASGRAKIDAAKADGSWSVLDSVEAMEMPSDLVKAFKRSPTARRNYEAFPRGVRKRILFWLVSAKRAETRAQRVRQTVAMAAENLRSCDGPARKGFETRKPRVGTMRK